MAAGFNLNQGEFEYLAALFGVGKIIEFWNNGKVQKKVTPSIEYKHSLLSKRYILEEQNKEMKILAPLLHTMQAIKENDAVFTATEMEKQNIIRKFVFYFYKNEIYMIEKKEQSYELIPFPSVTLAIGALANRVGTFKNKETHFIKETRLDRISRGDIISSEKVIEKQWLFTGQSKDEKKKNCLFAIMETGEEQFMIEMTDEEENTVVIQKQDKKDFINGCLNWFKQAV